MGRRAIHDSKTQTLVDLLLVHGPRRTGDLARLSGFSSNDVSGLMSQRQRKSGDVYRGQVSMCWRHVSQADSGDRPPPGTGKGAPISINLEAARARLRAAPRLPERALPPSRSVFEAPPYRSPALSVRAGALDYRNIPSLAGERRLPYHIGGA